jgi:uncharacterized protein (UPF0335 family)
MNATIEYTLTNRSEVRRSTTMNDHHETMHQATKDQLKSIITRIEKLEEEKAALSSDIKDIYAEAKSNGYDVKALRRIVQIRKKDNDERMEEETILATYMHALGMIQDPLPFNRDEMRPVSHLERVRNSRELEDA